MDRLFHRLRHSHRISSRPQLDHSQAVARDVLCVRNIKERPRLPAAVELKFRIARNPNHFQFALLLRRFSEGVAIGS